MTFTLIRNGETAQFQPAGEFVEITETTTQEVAVHVEECFNEWYGLCRPTGEIQTQIIKGSRWTSVTRSKARNIWREMLAQGWAAA